METTPTPNPSEFKIVKMNEFIHAGQCVVKFTIKDKPSSGFFLQFKIGSSVVKSFVTNYHSLDSSLIDKKITLKLKYDNEKREKRLILDKSQRGIWTFNKPIDITIIQILSADGIADDFFLEVDESITSITQRGNYVGQPIYVLQYPLGGELHFSPGRIKEVFNDSEYDFGYESMTLAGSGGAPLVIGPELKVVGIHKGKDNQSNVSYATFLKTIVRDIDK